MERSLELSLAESGAAALAGAANALDRAADADSFLQALEHNRRLWRSLGDVARRQNWPLPDQRMTEFALGTTTKPGPSDDEVHALVAVNRRVAAALAGDDLDTLRQRATTMWRRRAPSREADLDPPGREADLDTPGREADLDTPGREADLDTPGREADLDNWLLTRIERLG